MRRVSPWESNNHVKPEPQVVDMDEEILRIHPWSVKSPTPFVVQPNHHPPPERMFDCTAKTPECLGHPGVKTPMAVGRNEMGRETQARARGGNPLANNQPEEEEVSPHLDPPHDALYRRTPVQAIQARAMRMVRARRGVYVILCSSASRFRIEATDPLERSPSDSLISS